MGYVTYSDLCDRYTKKNVDEPLAPFPPNMNELEKEQERDRLINVFSAEAESYGAKALEPFKDFSEEFNKTGQDRDEYLVSVFTDYVAGKLFGRKAGSNQNKMINENFQASLMAFHKMYKGNMPIPAIPLKEKYNQGDVNTFITNAFFEKPKY